jgi:uncharacterized protein (TIGR02246 family)
MTGHRICVAAAAMMLALSTEAVAAQTSGPNAEVQATVEAALTAAQAGDLQRLQAQYAPDCVFVDEFAPFRWSGPNAIENYLASAAHMYRETQHGGVKMTASPPRYIYVSGDDAYVIEHLSETATVKGKPYDSAGSLVFTLTRIDHVWKITSQTWTKTSENMNPY